MNVASENFYYQFERVSSRQLKYLRTKSWHYGQICTLMSLFNLIVHDLNPNFAILDCMLFRESLYSENIEHLASLFKWQSQRCQSWLISKHVVTGGNNKCSKYTAESKYCRNSGSSKKKKNSH